MSDVEQRLARKGLYVPDPASPVASYVPAVTTGNLTFISGQGPKLDGGLTHVGVVGDTVTEEEAVAAAEVCALNVLAALKAEIGDLDRVVRVVKLLGFVASARGFTRQPFVMNGASEVFAVAFGDAGRHARSAIGTNQLPFDIPVEVEAIFEVRPAQN